jgi:hypothetical protein
VPLPCKRGNALSVEGESFPRNGLYRRCHAPIRIACRNADSFGAEVKTDQRAARRH